MLLRLHWETLPSLLVGWGGKHPSHPPPFLNAFGVSIPSVFGTSSLDASTRCPVVIIKSRRLVFVVQAVSK